MNKVRSRDEFYPQTRLVHSLKIREHRNFRLILYRKAIWETWYIVHRAYAPASKAGQKHGAALFNQVEIKK